jgi:hypothetical protein
MAMPAEKMSQSFFDQEGAASEDVEIDKAPEQITFSEAQTRVAGLEEQIRLLLLESNDVNLSLDEQREVLDKIKPLREELKLAYQDSLDKLDEWLKANKRNFGK